MGVCTKELKGVTAVVLMATPCTNSLVPGGESEGHMPRALLPASSRHGPGDLQRRKESLCISVADAADRMRSSCAWCNAESWRGLWSGDIRAG